MYLCFWDRVPMCVCVFGGVPMYLWFFSWYAYVIMLGWDAYFVLD
jgi:hypothetical protein